MHQVTEVVGTSVITVVAVALVVVHLQAFFIINLVRHKYLAKIEFLDLLFIFGAKKISINWWYYNGALIIATYNPYF